MIPRAFLRKCESLSLTLFDNYSACKAKNTFVSNPGGLVSREQCHDMQQAISNETMRLGIFDAPFSTQTAKGFSSFEFFSCESVVLAW